MFASKHQHEAPRHQQFFSQNSINPAIPKVAVDRKSNNELFGFMVHNSRQKTFSLLAQAKQCGESKPNGTTWDLIVQHANSSFPNDGKSCKQKSCLGSFACLICFSPSKTSTTRLSITHETCSRLRCEGKMFIEKPLLCKLLELLSGCVTSSV